MEAASYFISLALAFAILSYGLMRRPTWMWHLGWVIFYLLAAKWGEWFFTGLREAKNGAQVAWACVYLAGGLVIWLPSVVWWSTNRGKFGNVAKSQASP